MSANFSGFWSRLAAANPAMRDESTKMTMSVAAMKSLLEKAYRQGAADMDKAAGEFGDVGAKPGADPIPGQLKGMFGMK
jgi:hypothetical protein